MMIQYSSTTRTFYPSTINYPDLPDDVIQVAKIDYDSAQTRPAGYTFDFVNGELVITPPAEPTLDEVKAGKLAEIAGAFSARMAVVKEGYPNDEIQSWFQQSAEAINYTADPQAATPLLSAMASARGITVADLAARVLSNAAAFATVAGELIGKRQKYEDAVRAAPDTGTVAAIVWTD